MSGNQIRYVKKIIEKSGGAMFARKLGEKRLEAEFMCNARASRCHKRLTKWAWTVTGVSVSINCNRVFVTWN